MKTRPSQILVSPLYILSLGLLLLNDFLLKPTFHNWFTGKLSDFAGLFVFPLFFVAFSPRHRRTTYFLTALLFCFWKSGYSQPAIDAWNGLSIVPLARVKDITDALALVVLPFSYWYSTYMRRHLGPRVIVFLSALLSVFAFCATSFQTEVDYANTYHFEESRTELTRRVYHLGDINPDFHISPCGSESSSEQGISIEIPTDFCFGRVTAHIVIREEDSKSLMTLKKMEHRCPKSKDDHERLLGIFERDFIAKIKMLDSISAPEPASIDSSTLSARPQSIPSSNRLYLLKIGDVPEINLEGLIKELTHRYGVPITVMPQIPLTDDERWEGLPDSRAVAPNLIEAMKRRNPEISSDSKSIIIGITEDMNVPESHRILNFNYQSEGRFAVVAIDGLNPTTFCESPDSEVLESRLQKVLAKNIGALCYGLQPSTDPQSVMYSSIGCVHELDKMGKNF